jgi:hypothetical protein
MSYAAKTVLVFGVYMLGQGIILMTYPNFLLGLFHFPFATEVWVKVVGVALVVFSFYYIRCSLLELKTFFELSVQGRTLQLVLFAILVITKQIQPILLAFALFEFLMGVWTYFALKKS